MKRSEQIKTLVESIEVFTTQVVIKRQEVQEFQRRLDGAKYDLQKILLELKDQEEKE